MTKFGSHDLVDWKVNLRKEKEANIASMANGTEAPLKTSTVQSCYGWRASIGRLDRECMRHAEFAMGVTPSRYGKKEAIVIQAECNPVT